MTCVNGCTDGCTDVCMYYVCTHACTYLFIYTCMYNGTLIIYSGNFKKALLPYKQVPPQGVFSEAVQPYKNYLYVV